jgi:CheY-like chemotaxis protein
VLRLVKKILVVDDEEDIVYLLKALFSRNGYSVTGASSGEECLELLESENPDLIFMDIMMPGLDGWETARKIKTDPQTKNIPIIMLSVKCDPGACKKSHDYSFAEEHLAKPIDSKVVIRTAKNLILS